METFLLKLAVAVIPLVLLIFTVNLIHAASRRYSHHPLVRHFRRRRHVTRLHALGAMVR